jgi:iron complex outermembrane receptor protein
VLGRIRLEVQQVFAQDMVAENETTTAGYTMLNAYYSREFPVGSQTWEFFVRGTNLLSEKARNAVSFTKDVAPLPGASAMAGIRYRF